MNLDQLVCLVGVCPVRLDTDQLFDVFAAMRVVRCQLPLTLACQQTWVTADATMTLGV